MKLQNKLVLLMLLSAQVVAQAQFSTMFYTGITAQQTFGQIMGGKFTNAREYIYAGELAYHLGRESWVRTTLGRLVDDVAIAGNYTFRNDVKYHDHIHEGNMYVMCHWDQFPWREQVYTSVGLGDGISYAGHPPQVDKITADPGQSFRKLLNYFMVEVAMAHPRQPWHLVLRLHHRCTMWGVYGHNNAGSTNLALGLRYHFN